MSDEKKLTKSNGIVDPEKRETLKKLGALAYAAPATMLLVSADRATAQSVTCEFRVVNNNQQFYVTVTGPGVSGGSQVAANGGNVLFTAVQGSQVNIDVQGPGTANFSSSGFTPAINANAAQEIDFTFDDCDGTITINVMAGPTIYVSDAPS